MLSGYSPVTIVRNCARILKVAAFDSVNMAFRHPVQAVKFIFRGKNPQKPMLCVVSLTGLTYGVAAIACLLSALISHEDAWRLLAGSIFLAFSAVAFQALAIFLTLIFNGTKRAEMAAINGRV